MCDSERGSGPKGANDLCLASCLDLGLEAEILTSRLGFWPHDGDLSLKAGFWAAAPKGTKSCRTQGDFLSFVRSSVRVCRFETRGWDLSLEAGI